MIFLPERTLEENMSLQCFGARLVRRMVCSFAFGTLTLHLVAAAESGIPANPATGTLVIQNQNHQVYKNLKISTDTGDCIQILDSTDITIEDSEIGPCGGDGVNINGSANIQIFDSYIHPETLSPGCCDHNDGIAVQNASTITIQGNVIAYGESNVEVIQAVKAVTLIGNFLLNPRGPFPRGSNFEGWHCSNITVKNNYTLSSSNTNLYLYPDDQEDSINFGMGSDFIAEGNYVTGGQSPSGCGLIADDGANDVQITRNRVVDAGQCGIGIASGTNPLVDHNRIINRNPVQGGGNTALYIWSQYNGIPCGPATISGNIATELLPNGSQSGFWNGGGCDPVTLAGDIWDEAAEKLLTPVETKLPPPLIPPHPKHCVAQSPYSTQTQWPACP